MRNLGTHIAGQASSCTLPGIVPIRFDTFRKTLRMPSIALFLTTLIHQQRVSYLTCQTPHRILCFI